MRSNWPLLVALAWLPACDDDDASSSEPDTIEIAGNYVERFMGAVVTEHAITAETWTQTFSGPMGTTVVYTLGEVENDGDYVLAEITADDGTTSWSRFDWVEHEGQLYYCTSVFGAADADTARAGSADPSDPANGGCAMFSWSALESR